MSGSSGLFVYSTPLRHWITTPVIMFSSHEFLMPSLDTLKFLVWPQHGLVLQEPTCEVPA
jgi:hypothetical protein